MIKLLPKILIVSSKADLATDYVVLKLQQHKVDFLRLNTEDFPLESLSSISLTNNVNKLNWSWVYEGNHYGFEKLQSVWYRRHRLPEMPSELSDSHTEYCLRESDWFIKGCLWQLEQGNEKLRWMSSPTYLRRADSKILQLQIAKELGFIIPETLISNDPVEVRKFFSKQDGEIIAKPLRLGYFDYGEKQTSVYTTKINLEHLENNSEIKLSPVIYQKHLPKKYDVRVTVVGEKVFAAAIDSQKIPSAIIDWRRTETDDIKHYKHELPQNIKEKCITYTKALGLNYGAIDFVLTKENEYYFLEINPNGQWVWIEDKLEFPISNEIAKWLKQ